MAYRCIHTKPNGTKYVYAAEGYWDKEKKAPRNRQVCLGRLNEETGEIIPSKQKARVAKRAAAAPEVTAKALVAGPSMILDRAAEQSGLAAVLRKCFPGQHEHLLSLAYFLVQKGLPLSRCENWSSACKHPFGEVIPSQRVSDLLQSLSEGQRQSFLTRWLKSLTEKECLCYDITSISSYAEGNEYVRRGHNRDLENLPQINLSLLFGQKSGLPAYYRRLPGSIPDVSALKTTLANLDFLGQTSLQLVLDRGFYSRQNVDALLAARYNFLLAVPLRKWTEELYDRCREEILSPFNRRQSGDKEALFMMTKAHSWNGRRCYTHIYFNNRKAAEEYDSFALKLSQWREELENGQDKEENSEYYQRFFTVKETPKRGRKVIPNEAAAEEARKKYVGFFCLLSTQKMTAAEALDIYRRKEVVENCFDDLKNQLDMRRLRIHSSGAMDSRLFIQFLALILLSQIRLVAGQDEKLKNLTVREIMEAMETIVEIRYSGRYGSLTTEAGKIQRHILNAFRLQP